MRHHNSVFHQIQKHVPWGVFDRLVDEYKADYRVRKLTTKSQFLALLFGQLAGAVSLREIEAPLIASKTRPSMPSDKLARRSGVRLWARRDFPWERGFMGTTAMTLAAWWIMKGVEG